MKKIISINKKILFNYSVLLLIILLELDFFRIIDISNLPGHGPNIRMLTVRIAIFAFLWIIITRKKSSIYLLNNYKYVSKMLLFLLIFLFIEGIYSVILYKQSFFNIKWACYYFAVFVLILPLIEFFEKKGSINEFLKMFNILVLLYCILSIAQAIIYNINGKQILFIRYDLFRNERIRIGLGSITGLFISYNMLQIIKYKKNKIFRVFSIIILLFGLFYCEMTRANQIAALVTIISCYFLNKKLDFKKLIAVMIGIIVIIYCIENGVFDYFFSSIFSKRNNNMYTTQFRLNSINYFFEYWLKHPIMGMGFILPNRSDLKQILYGPSGIAYFDDIGLIGFILHFGLWGLIIIVLTFGRMSYIIFKNRKKEYEYKTLLFGIFIYYLATSPSLSLFDPQRIVMWPICLGIFEYVNKKLRLKEKKV